MKSQSDDGDFARPEESTLFCTVQQFEGIAMDEDWDLVAEALLVEGPFRPICPLEFDAVVLLEEPEPRRFDTLSVPIREGE